MFCLFICLVVCLFKCVCVWCVCVCVCYCVLLCVVVCVCVCVCVCVFWVCGWHRDELALPDTAHPFKVIPAVLVKLPAEEILPTRAYCRSKVVGQQYCDSERRSFMRQYTC